MPKNERFLLVGNHISNFDSIVQWRVLRKERLAFISKESNFKIPFFGRLARRCCFLEIDRANPRNAVKTVEDAVEMIKEDKVVFSEITETLNIQKEELTEARWFSIETLQGMVDRKELEPNQISCFVKCLNFLEKKRKN